MDIQKKKCQKYTSAYEEVLRTITDRLHKDFISYEKDFIFYENVLKNNQAKIKLWETKGFTEIPEKSSKKSMQKKANLKKDQNAKPCDVIADINAEIMKDKGPYGDFYPEEHTAFVKVWVKINGNKDRIVQSIRKYAPEQLKFRTSEELVEHSEWYLRHKERLKRKKLCIASWKQQKNTEEANQQEEERKSNENKVKIKSMKEKEKVQKEQEKKKEIVKAWRREKEKKDLLEHEESQRILRENKTLNKWKVR